MKKLVAWTILSIVVLAVSFILPGCSTGRAAVGLVGGIGRDLGQGSQFILDHTQESDARSYNGHREQR